MRYATPCPATLPACERNRPFFLKTKLDPMRKPLTTARIIPTTLRLELVDVVDDTDDVADAVADDVDDADMEEDISVRTSG